MKTETILAQALGDMKSRQGVTLADLRPDEIVALVEACAKVANPFDEVNAEASGLPVAVTGDVWFWPLTIGAVAWLEATADKWWSDNPRRYRNALVYAAKHAREPGAFGSIERGDVERGVRETLRGITATSAEVDAALERVLGLSDAASPSRNGESAPTAVSWAALVAKVEAATGLAREHWLWGVSYRETLRTYHEARQIALAMRGERSERMLDELDAAVNRLQCLKVNIMKRVKHDRD